MGISNKHQSATTSPGNGQGRITWTSTTNEQGNIASDKFTSLSRPLGSDNSVLPPHITLQRHGWRSPSPAHPVHTTGKSVRGGIPRVSILIWLGASTTFALCFHQPSKSLQTWKPYTVGSGCADLSPALRCRLPSAPNANTEGAPSDDSQFCLHGSFILAIRTTLSPSNARSNNGERRDGTCQFAMRPVPPPLPVSDPAGSAPTMESLGKRALFPLY